MELWSLRFKNVFLIWDQTLKKYIKTILGGKFLFYECKLVELTYLG